MTIMRPLLIGGALCRKLSGRRRETACVELRRRTGGGFIFQKEESTHKMITLLM
ncbi:MAG: hypothetical protein IKD86_00230 [Firmicutes bacterium]|nr:hypothetical protein [Bacillota bacterium]